MYLRLLLSVPILLSTVHVSFGQEANKYLQHLVKLEAFFLHSNIAEEATGIIIGDHAEEILILTVKHALKKGGRKAKKMNIRFRHEEHVFATLFQPTIIFSPDEDMALMILKKSDLLTPNGNKISLPKVDQLIYVPGRIPLINEKVLAGGFGFNQEIYAKLQGNAVLSNLLTRKEYQQETGITDPFKDLTPLFTIGNTGVNHGYSGGIIMTKTGIWQGMIIQNGNTGPILGVRTDAIFKFLEDYGPLDKINKIQNQFSEIGAVISIQAGQLSHKPFSGGRFEYQTCRAGADEKRDHSPWIHSFEIGLYEVTIVEFCEFLNERMNQEQGGNSYYSPPRNFPKEEQPVVVEHARYRPRIPEIAYHPMSCITWIGAKEYCNWLSKKSGSTYTYRLPTEDEWEYVARMELEAMNVASSFVNYFNFDNIYVNDQEPIHVILTSPVNSMNASPGGIFHMLGNVWEWCEDFYVALRYDVHEEDDGNLKVVKGGGWMSDSCQLRIENRHMRAAQRGHIDVGFRVVRTKN
ncbi:MAG: SUMF1/EgtB/PvdO family nonheme iron enzyme [Bacteroidota bacterium]